MVKGQVCQPLKGESLSYPFALEVFAKLEVCRRACAQGLRVLDIDVLGLAIYLLDIYLFICFFFLRQGLSA